MANFGRATVTPNDLVQEIDRPEELRKSLMNPHPENAELSETGLQEWARNLPEEDTEALVDVNAGQPVRWTPGEGWMEIKRPRRR